MPGLQAEDEHLTCRESERPAAGVRPTERGSDGADAPLEETGLEETDSVEALHAEGVPPSTAAPDGAEARAGR